MRKLNWIAATTVLLVMGVLGLANGVRDVTNFDAGAPFLQRSVALAVLGYGIFGLAAAVALFRRRRVSVPLAIACSVGGVWAATVASFAFHDPTFSQEGTVVGVSSAALATMAICGWVVWTAWRESRDRSLPPAAVSGDIQPR